MLRADADLNHVANDLLTKEEGPLPSSVTSRLEGDIAATVAPHIAANLSERHIRAPRRSYRHPLKQATRLKRIVFVGALGAVVLLDTEATIVCENVDSAWRSGERILDVCRPQLFCSIHGVGEHGLGHLHCSEGARSVLQQQRKHLEALKKDCELCWCVAEVIQSINFSARIE